MLVAWTDGHCAPNPGGRAAWAFLVRDAPDADAPVLHHAGGIAAREGAGSGALAEWRAAFEALRWLSANARPLDAREVVLRTDHNGVWKSLSGKAGVPVAPRRRKLAQECRKFTNQLREDGVRVRFERVPRHENAEADALARAAWEEGAAREGAEEAGRAGSGGGARGDAHELPPSRRKTR